MVEMTIDSIRVSLTNYQRVVILKEKAADRYLPIWIGPAEADAIAVKLQDVSVPRPLTHDLLGKIIGELGARVESVIVSDLQNDTFFAKIMIVRNGGATSIDSRPSDALALAVRVNVPIFVEETVLSKAAIFLDKETGKPVPAADAQASAEERKAPVNEEEIKRMSAFKEFIDTLDLSGLGKEKEGGKDGGKDGGKEGGKEGGKGGGGGQ